MEAPGSTAVAAAAVAVLPPPVEQDSKEEELLPSQTQACRESVELFKGEGPVAVLQPATAAELGADQHEQPSGQEALANDDTSTNSDHREEHVRLEPLVNSNGTDMEEGGETNSGDIKVAANPAGEHQQDAHSDPVNGTENELDSQTDEATDRPDVETKQRGELDSSSASQGNEVGFKKIFKFGGFKFTMKKDKAAQPEPAHLLKVSRGGEEGAPPSDVAHQAPRGDKPDEQPVGATEPAQDASAGSGGAQGAEWSGGGGGEEEDIVDLEIVDEEEVAEAIAAEAAASIAASVCKPPAEPLKEEAPVPPLKKMSGLFAGLRKKAGDKQKREEAAARAAAEDVSRRPDDTRAEVEGKVAELARALEAHARGEEQVPDDQQPCSSKSEATPVVLVSVAHVLEAATCEEASSDPPAGQQQQKLAAAKGESTLETADKSKGTNEAAADDDHEGDATDTSARDKARTHEGPLKKFFKGSGLKKLPSLKRKVTKEREESEHLTGDEGESGTDGKRAQPSISVEDNNPGSPAHAKEADSPHPGAAAVMADGRNLGAVRKREGITVWSSFKKLVTPKKRVKKAAESDTDDDPEDQADERSKSGAPAAEGKSQESRGETEEVKVTVEVHSTVEPTTIATVVTATTAAAVTVEDASSEAALETAALTVAASDEARTDEDVAICGTAPAASDAEVTGGPEAAAATAAGEEERRDESKLATGSPEGTETTAGSGGRAEGAAKQGDDGRAGDSPKRESAWESFKRLVTPKKKAKAKGDNQAAGGDEEDVLQRAAADLKRDVERAAQSQKESPKRECAKAENPSAAGWSIKKLFPGMRRRKADADAEGAEAEAAASPASGRVKCAEVHQDTPSVVPLSEFESGDLSVQVEHPTAVEKAELSVSQEQPPEAASEVVLGVPTVAVVAVGPAGDDGVLNKADEPCNDREEGGSSDDASVSANAAGPTDGASRMDQPAGAASETSVTTSDDRSQHGSALAKEGETNALQNVTVDNNLAQVKIVVDAPSVTATQLETPDSKAACEGSKEVSPSLIVTENAPEKPNLSPDERDEENADKDCASVVCVIAGAESESHTAVPEAARAKDGGIDGASGDLSTTTRLPDLVTDASAAKDGSRARTLPGDILATDIGCTLNGKQQSECQERAAFHEVQLKQTTVQSAANLAEQTIEQNATGETRSSRAAEEMAEEIPVQSVKDAMEAYKIPLETMVMQAPQGQDLEVIMEEDTESPPISGAAAAPEDGARPPPAAVKVNAEEHEWPTTTANLAWKSGVALEEETAEESDHGKGLPVIHDGHNNSNNNHHLDDVNSQAPLDCASVEGDKPSEITSKAIPNSAGSVETPSQQNRADGPMSENNGPEDLSSENSLGNSNSKDSTAQTETATDRTQEKPPPPPPLSEGGLLMAAAQSSVS